MAALTDPKVTAYSTVTSLDADLAVAEAAFDSLQSALEALLESGAATMAAVAEAEERIAAAQHERDELRGTRNFLVDRQRRQAEGDGDGLLYAIVLCQWHETALVSSEDVTDYTTALYTANEMNGVTGAVYILRGWFAHYFEGPPAIVNRMCREMKANKKQFSLVVVAEKDSIKAAGTANAANDSMSPPAKDFNARAAIARDTAALIASETNSSGSNGVTVLRRYPNESLRIVRVDDAPLPAASTAHMAHPETVVLRELALMMGLFRFVPEFCAVNRGKGRFETPKGTNLLVKNDPTSAAVGGYVGPGASPSAAAAAEAPAFPMVPRAVALITPFGDLWEAMAAQGADGEGAADDGVSTSDVNNNGDGDDHQQPAITVKKARVITPELISQLFRTVHERAAASLVDRSQRSFAAGLVGPHTQDGLYVVIESGNMAYAMDLLTDLLAELNAIDDIREVYKPIIVLDHSPDVGLIVNGTCGIVGPISRQLRKLATVARQEAIPFLTSYRVADMAGRSGCHSVGVYVIDKDPSELFTHVTQLGKVGAYAGAEAVAALRARADEAQRAVESHVEGPGAIELGCEGFGIRGASAAEAKALASDNAQKKRSAAYVKGYTSSSSNGLPPPTMSYFSTGTLDAPRPPANLSSTKEVIAALSDPTGLVGVKSLAALTADFKGQRVMKNDECVRPSAAATALSAATAVDGANGPAPSSPSSSSAVGSALNAARSSRATASATGAGRDGAAAAANGLSTRGAHASRVVQSVSYFAPKGIQGDAEFRAIYDELPTEWGGPAADAGPCATRRGFDLYYYSLEHFGTEPTPAVVDELLGKTAHPNFVTFEQFCMVMHKYQRM